MTPKPDASERETSDPSKADAEVDALRQRLAFFEGFEHIIQENIARSGELLHLAAQRQAEADQAAAAARDELDREIGRNLQELSALGAEIAALRDAADGLVGRVAAAIATGDRRIPGPTPTDSRSSDHGTWEPNQAPALARPVQVPDLSSPTLTPAPIETPMPSTARLDEARGANFQVGPDAEEVTHERPPGHRANAGAWRSGDRVAQSVVVHGISDVSRARSLVDYLRNLEAIDTVEPKEFLDGLLRLAVVGRQLRRDDFGGWGGEAQVVEEGATTLVLRLPATRSL